MADPPGLGRLQSHPSHPPSPLDLYLGAKGQHLPVCGVCLQQTGPPEGILQRAAKHAFWDVTRQMLQKLALEQG
eukprot:9850829-Lingulodinium_polyedra.AAC.1